MKVIVVMYLIFDTLIFFTQKIDNTVSYRDMGSDQYFRVNYDNDYFSASDFNYTQGYSLELVTPHLSKNPLNRILISKKNLRNQYGLSIDHMGFTPFDIVDLNIIITDRPFAAAIMLKSFVTCTDTVKNYRVISGLSLGVMGSTAFGNAMQTGIHKAIGDDLPQGWPNQIKDDLVLNYELGYEKKLVSYKNHFILASNSTLKLGTWFTSASVGVNASFGVFNSVFSNEVKTKKIQFLVYAQPLVNFVGYDASMQGGLLNKKSPHTIKASDIERITTQFKYGAIIRIKTLYLEYSQVILSKEYSFGPQAQWGGVKIGWLFK